MNHTLSRTYPDSTTNFLENYFLWKKVWASQNCSNVRKFVTLSTTQNPAARITFLYNSFLALLYVRAASSSAYLIHCGRPAIWSRQRSLRGPKHLITKISEAASIDILFSLIEAVFFCIKRTDCRIWSSTTCTTSYWFSGSSHHMATEVSEAPSIDLGFSLTEAIFVSYVGP